MFLIDRIVEHLETRIILCVHSLRHKTARSENIQHDVHAAFAQTLQKIVIAVGECRVDLELVNALRNVNFRNILPVFPLFRETVVAGERAVKKMKTQNVHAGKPDLFREFFYFRFREGVKTVFP